MEKEFNEGSSRSSKLEALAARIDESPFFLLDPELDSTKREFEKNKLIELLYEYEMLLDSSALEELGLEFMEIFAACVKSYDPGSGQFTHYFNASFRREKVKKFAEEKVAGFTGGVRMSKDAKRGIYKVAKFLESHPDIPPEKLLHVIGEFTEEFDMTEKELKEAIRTYYNSHAERLDAPISDDDGGTSLQDIIAGGEDFTDRIMAKDHILYVIDVLDECCGQKRVDAKPVISAYITSMLADLYEADPDYLDYAREKEFFDETVYNMVSRIGRPLRLNEIQQYLNKKNITNTVKNFLLQVKEKLE